MHTFLDIITPNNLLEEEEKFFKSESYEPIFHYNWEKDESICLNPELRDKFTDLICAKNLDGALEYVKGYFEVDIEEDLTIKAKEIIAQGAPKLEKQYDVYDAQKEFQKAFKFFGIDYTAKIVDERGFNFRPSHDDRILKISKFANLQFFDVKGTARHELVHILRHVNGVANGIDKVVNYLPTEEGLASLMQDWSKNGQISLFEHAAEYVASSIGSHGTLRDIYNYLKSIGFNDKLAWQRSARHKFGFTDTSVSGDIMKPAMYFYHETRLKQLPPEKLLKLFVGKISEKELDSIKEYRGEIPKEKIIEFYNL